MELRECLLLKTVTATLNEQSWTYCFDASRKGDINNVFSLPRYSFTVLEDSGWNFRHAYYHEMNRRTLLKVVRNHSLNVTGTSMSPDHDGFDANSQFNGFHPFQLWKVS